MHDYLPIEVTGHQGEPQDGPLSGAQVRIVGARKNLSEHDCGGGGGCGNAYEVTGCPEVSEVE